MRGVYIALLDCIPNMSGLPRPRVLNGLPVGCANHYISRAIRNEVSNVATS